MSLKQLNQFRQAMPSIDIRRSKFNRSHSHKTTIKAGDLVPIFYDEVIPGDTFILDTNVLARMILPAVPVMDDIYCDTYFFWVPARLCTQGEKDFQQIFGQNDGGYWAPATEKTLSNTGNMMDFGYLDDTTSHEVNPDSIMNYFGFGAIGKTGANLGDSAFSGFQFSKLPFVAYGLIWNEWFRDENTQAPIDPKAGSFLQHIHEADSCLKANKFHDYFTSCLPAPQKGGSVSLPLGTLAPVVSIDTVHAGNTAGVYTGFDTTGFTPGADFYVGSRVTGSNQGKLGTVLGPAGEDQPVDYNKDIYFRNLWTDLSTATATTVSELRTAFAIQKMLETDARTGTRYREMLKGHFGVTIPDTTIQVPEYLGGKRFSLNVNEVVQHSGNVSGSTPLGTLGGISTTFNHSKSFVKSFNEFGYVIGVMVIRNQQSYSSMIPPLWTRNRRYDWYDPKFANLSEQAVMKTSLDMYSIWKNNTSSKAQFDTAIQAVFGYQEAWADYRYKSNLVTGALNPEFGNNDFGIWTFANLFDTVPSLASFMPQGKDQVARSLIDTSTNYQFIVDMYFDYKCIRPMPVFSIPGLVDHH